MPTPQKPIDLSHLSAAERIHLVQELWESIHDDAQDDSRALMIVTHHIEFAKAVADEVAFLWNGRVHESGPAEPTLENPKTTELASFLRTLKRTW